MFHLMDYEALGAGVRARRQAPVRGSQMRAHYIRRRVGGWLLGVGARLAEDEPAAWRTATDSG